MAIFHCEVKSISRSDGRTATAAASYRAGAKIKDERTQTQYDYTKKRNVISAHIIMPSDVKLKINRSDLWNTAEYAEKRKDAKVAREYEIALPAELPLEAQRQLAITFAQTIADRFHVAADVAIHKPDRRGDERNVHAHILTTTRRINDKGELTEKTRELDTKPTSAKHVEAIREIWADLCNKELERHGRSERIDHRTLESQGIDRVPQIHVGVHATQMERRGIQTERGEANRRIIAANKHIDGLKTELSKVETTIAELKQQRKQRELQEAEQAAAAARAQAEEKARQEAMEREKQERQAAERKAKEEQRKRQEQAAVQQQPKAKQPVSSTQKPAEGAKVEKTANDTPKPQEAAKKPVIDAEQVKQPVKEIDVYHVFNGVLMGECCICLDGTPIIGPFENRDKAEIYMRECADDVRAVADGYRKGQKLQEPKEYYTREEIRQAQSVLNKAEARIMPQVEQEELCKMDEKLAPYRKREATLSAEIKKILESEPKKKLLERQKTFDERHNEWHKALVEKIKELDEVRKKIDYILTHVDPWQEQRETQKRAKLAEPLAAKILEWAKKQEAFKHERERQQQKSRSFGRDDDGWEM